MVWEEEKIVCYTLGKSRSPLLRLHFCYTYIIRFLKYILWLPLHLKDNQNRSDSLIPQVHPFCAEIFEWRIHPRSNFSKRTDFELDLYDNIKRYGGLIFGFYTSVSRSFHQQDTNAEHARFSGKIIKSVSRTIVSTLTRAWQKTRDGKRSRWIYDCI